MLRGVRLELARGHDFPNGSSQRGYHFIGPLDRHRPECMARTASIHGSRGSWQIGTDSVSRAHRQILHLARLLDRLASDLAPDDVDRYLIRDAQRVIEAIEALVRLHNAQEEGIYEQAGSG